jgi:hypothetical protein
MRIEPWKEALDESGFSKEFPDKAAAILHAIQFGASVEFSGNRSKPVRGRNSDRGLTPQIRDKVSAVIAADCVAGKKAGPFSELPFPNMFVSPIGAVPKQDSDKIRVIHNLSHPFDGDSVNAGIPSVDEKCARLADATAAIVRTGRGCFLIKLDVEAAYKQVPVCPEDWHLLGFWWLDAYFYERVLPFGLRSSCRIWELFAWALHYFFEKYLGVPIVIHYVDDFLLVFEFEAAARALLPLVLQLCRDLGVPMAEDKTEGPISHLVFLGIHLDTEAMRASLPERKMLKLLQLANEWVKEVKKKRTIHELQSLAGKLTFACQVVRSGCFFTRRLIARIGIMTRQLASLTYSEIELASKPWSEILKAASRSQRSWLVTEEMRNELRWWIDHLRSRNGINLLADQEWISDSSVVEVETDACRDGQGGVCREQWFAGAWSPEQMAVAEHGCEKGGFSIAFLELHAIVQAAAIWGPQWRGSRVLFRSDSGTSVHDIQSGYGSGDARMSHLLRHLARLGIEHDFEFRALHIPGLTNIHADVLSRFGDCPLFRSQRPQACAQPTSLATIPLPAVSRKVALRSVERHENTSAYQ